MVLLQVAGLCAEGFAGLGGQAMVSAVLLRTDAGLAIIDFGSAVSRCPSIIISNPCIETKPRVSFKLLLRCPGTILYDGQTTCGTWNSP